MDKHIEMKKHSTAISLFICVLMFMVILSAQVSAASSECSSVKLIYKNVDICDSQKVILTGKVSDFKLQTSGKGNKYTTFMLNDTTAKPIKIYSYSHLKNISEGNTIQVTGTFNKVLARKDFEFPMQITTTPNGVTIVKTVIIEKRETVTKPKPQTETPKSVEPAPQRVATPEPAKPSEVMPKTVAPTNVSKQEGGSTNTLFIFVIVGIILIGGVVVFILKRGNKKSQPVAEKISSPQPSVESEQDKSSAFHDIGVQFEDYVLSRFDMRDWTVVDRTKDFSKELGRRVESDSNPDLVFRHKDAGKVIAIECKYRSSFMVNTKGDKFIQWASEFNIKNYNAYRERTRNRVFIAIGVGGTPSSPGRLFVVPLFALTKHNVSENYLNGFERNPEYKFLIEEFKKIDKGL